MYGIFLFPFYFAPELVDFITFFKYLVRNPRFHQSKALNESFRWVKTRVSDDVFEESYEANTFGCKIKWK